MHMRCLMARARDNVQVCPCLYMHMKCVSLLSNLFRGRGGRPRALTARKHLCKGEEEVGYRLKTNLRYPLSDSTLLPGEATLTGGCLQLLGYRRKDALPFLFLSSFFSELLKRNTVCPATGYFEADVSLTGQTTQQWSPKWKMCWSNMVVPMRL